MKAAGASIPQPVPGWSERRETITQLRRFLLIGLSSVAVDLSAYALFTHWLHLPTAPSKGVSYVLGMIVGFVGNKLWTFRSARRSAAEPITYVVLYAVTLAVNIGVNEGILAAGRALLEAPADRVQKLVAAFAALTATGITTILNFLGMRLVTFRAGIDERRSAARAASEPALSEHSPPAS